MKCSTCGRKLREDSNFCDWCGNTVVRDKPPEEVTTVFDVKTLIIGLGLSILITLLISGLAKSFNIPLLFGGLFLPFFFIKKKK